MQKRPPGMDVRVSKNSSIVLILPKKSTPIKLLNQQRSQGQPIVPLLPPHLDQLIDYPWSPEASREIDRFLWYLEQEFGLFGGAV